MKPMTVNKFRYFSVDEDEKQEEWLSSMAQQGLHLTEVDMFGRFKFVKGEPDNVAYRVDYIDSWKTDDYCRLFEDAGWERAAHIFGWYYWRKPVVDGVIPEIYTDPQSKIAKLQRMLITTALPAAIFVMVALNNKTMPWYLVLCFLAFVPFLAYQSFKVFKRIRTLRAES